MLVSSCCSSLACWACVWSPARRAAGGVATNLSTPEPLPEVKGQRKSMKAAPEEELEAPKQQPLLPTSYLFYSSPPPLSTLLSTLLSTSTSSPITTTLHCGTQTTALQQNHTLQPTHCILFPSIKFRSEIIQGEKCCESGHVKWFEYHSNDPFTWTQGTVLYGVRGTAFGSG